MPILEIERSARKTIPDPIIATKVSKGVQDAFDKLAVRKYHVPIAELLIAYILDCLKRHEEAKQKQ